MRYGYMVAALAALAIAGVLWPRPAAVEAEVGGGSGSRSIPARASDSAKSAVPRESRTSPAAAADVDEVTAIIEGAVVTYSPAGVATIRPYLLDPDPAIRRAARDGMVQLGEADAVPLLRDAAAKLDDPEEIAALREAADLLALPAWSDSAEAREAVEEIRQNR